MSSHIVNELQKLMRKALRSGDDNEFFRLLHENPDQLFASTVFGTWLHVAADYGRLNVIQRLVEMGMDLNLHDGVFQAAPIKLAASEGHLDIVGYLLSVGAVMDTDRPDRNPLFGAIYGGHPDVVSILLEHGIDSRIRYTGESMKGMDAIGFAEERGQIEIAEMIRDFQKMNP